MTTPTDISYLGVGGEASFGGEAASLFYIDLATSDLDAPADSENIHPGGLTRFKRTKSPGMYICKGKVGFILDPDTWYYFLKYFLTDADTGGDGSFAFTDNTTSVLAEAPASVTPADAATETFTTAKNPVIPGTVIIQTDVPADVAEDDGMGNITELAASGVTGTIDYGSGVVVLNGLTPTTNYEIDYDEGETAGMFEYIIKPTTNQDQQSLTFEIGKQQFQHTFMGCAINQIEIDFAKDWIMLSMDIMAQKDKYEARITLATLEAKLPQGFATAIGHVATWISDFGVALADESANVEAGKITITQNSDLEAGTVLNSRYPAKSWLGEFEIKVDLTMTFADQNEYIDFWGGATGPTTDGSTFKKLQFIINSTTDASDNGTGDCTIDIYKAILNAPKTPVSGRDRIKQELSFEGVYDLVADEILKIVCNSIQNWDTDS
jgi:hypothetical protein